MSTIPGRQSKPDAPGPPRARTKRPCDADLLAELPQGASYDYGFRYVRKRGQDGRWDWTMVPLTLEDVLHPKMDDKQLLSTSHDEDVSYLRQVFKAVLDPDPRAAVLADCGVDWGRPNLRHHSPDICVIFGVRKRKPWSTFRVADEKVRPTLIIEVSSPSSRILDVRTKVVQYAIAGVPHYVVADAEETGPTHDDESETEYSRVLELIEFRLENGVYQRQPATEHGRVWLEEVGLWLGIRREAELNRDLLVLIDPNTDQPIGDYTALNRKQSALVDRTRLAEEQARAATEAHEQALARIRELESELKRSRSDEQD